MTKIYDVMRVLETHFPKNSYSDSDPSGLKCGDKNAEVSGILVTLDTNVSIVKQAIKAGCNLIIEHHPIIWSPLSAINERIPTQKALALAIKKGIAILSAHINVDFAANGLNDYCAEIMGLSEIVLADANDIGSPRVGKVKKTTVKEYALHLKSVFNDKNIRIAGDKNKIIEYVAVTNGGGGGDDTCFLKAINFGADVFVTADVKHHVARLAKDLGYVIIECGHDNMEQFFRPLVASVLRENLPDTTVVEAVFDPVFN